MAENSVTARKKNVQEYIEVVASGESNWAWEEDGGDIAFYHLGACIMLITNIKKTITSSW